MGNIQEVTLRPRRNPRRGPAERTDKVKEPQRSGSGARDLVSSLRWAPSGQRPRAEKSWFLQPSILTNFQNDIFSMISMGKC